MRQLEIDNKLNSIIKNDDDSRELLLFSERLKGIKDEDISHIVIYIKEEQNNETQNKR